MALPPEDYGVRLCLLPPTDLLRVPWMLLMLEHSQCPQRVMETRLDPETRRFSPPPPTETRKGEQRTKEAQG